MAIEHSFRDFDAAGRKETFSGEKKFIFSKIYGMSPSVQTCDIHSAVSLSTE